VSAIKRQRDRPFTKEILEPDEPSLLVWQQERRHRLAHLRSRRSGITLREAADQRIDSGLEMWAHAARLQRPAAGRPTELPGCGSQHIEQSGTSDLTVPAGAVSLALARSKFGPEFQSGAELQSGAAAMNRAYRCRIVC